MRIEKRSQESKVQWLSEDPNKLHGEIGPRRVGRLRQNPACGTYDVMISPLAERYITSSCCYS